MRGETPNFQIGEDSRKPDTAADQTPEHIRGVWNRAADIRDAEESQTDASSPLPAAVSSEYGQSNIQAELSHVRGYINSFSRDEDLLQPEPEYIEVNEQEQALNQALEFARRLSHILRNAVPDRERQRALRDLVAIIDNQLQEERVLLKDPYYQRHLRPGDQQHFHRALEYLTRDRHTVDITPEQ